ncbi:MAG: terpene cyclase/mutase family protein [Pirellulaceae bacterium]|nr:terpene cyclase/mutase family protein [Pirellulaceae bacterium]
MAKPLPPQQQAMAAQAADVEVLEDDDALEEEEAPGRRRSRFLLLNAVPSWMVSMVVHAVLLIVLALLSFGPDLEQVKTMLSVVPSEVEEEIEQFEMEEFEPLDVEVTEVTTPTPVAAVATEVPQEVTEVAVANDVDAAPVHVDLVDFSERTAPRNDLMAEIGSVSGSGLEGRGAAQRGQMIAKYGGTPGSEEAVARALKWLALHQLPNGAWSFDHRNALTCQGKCSGQGTLDRGFNGATAMALLPFLGAGQTHKEGKYQETVRRGLYYLLSVQKPDGSLFESGGSMYSHGLCAITLCEAYAMTQDRELMMPAQASLNFIMYAQDPVGGGWRYQPKQAGDTSVVGWQLMALKSGHMAYLQVSPNTVLGTTKFLDSVQSDSGSKYGYTGPGAGTATTAVGLLCRMYLGWKKDNAALERGVEFLSATGPSKTNLYYNYYATQVMRHYEGDKWKKWNDEQRDWLVASQSREGHMEGSWLIKGDHGSDRGGRLYCTSMATMILEVYYRHLPIFRKESTTEEFPL